METLQQFCQRIREVVNAGAEGEIIEGAIAGDWLEAKEGWGFRPDCEYRVRHNMIKVNGFDIPTPETDEPELNTFCYIPDLISTEKVQLRVWSRSHSDLSALHRGLLHMRKHDAVMHANALLGINPYQGGE